MEKRNEKMIDYQLFEDWITYGDEIVERRYY
jgi:hypothetical protein